MKSALFLCLLAVPVLATATQQRLSSAPEPSRDRARQVLQLQASQAVQAGPMASIGFGPVPPGPGHLLFSMIGGENAECVRAIPDVTGDGLDEIVVGIGESGTDNLFCLDGASTGTASVVWSRQTAGGVSGGSCYGDQSIVRVSDTDTNFRENIMVGTAWGGRSAHNFDTDAGLEPWRFDTYLTANSGWVYSMCEVRDVTGDGVPDYAFGVGSDNDGLYLVSGGSPGPQADVVWRYPAGDAVYSVRNIGDVDLDGEDDVLAAIGDDIDRIVCLEGDSASPTGNLLWSYSPFVPVYAVGVLADITSDGVNEALAVLWTSAGSAIRCLDGSNGTLLWSSSAVGSFGMQAKELEDVTGDGKNDVIVCSWENAVTVLDGADGSLVWKTTVGTTNGGDVWTAAAIDDLDGDGFQDVIAGSFDYHVYALHGVTGQIFWAYDTGNRVFSVSPVGDLNGDGKPEVVAGTQDTNSSRVVYVLEGDAGI